MRGSGPKGRAPNEKNGLGKEPVGELGKAVEVMGGEWSEGETMELGGGEGGEEREGDVELEEGETDEKLAEQGPDV